MGPEARIAVVGAGLMGHGIAQVFASAGHRVSVFDPDAAARDGLKARIAGNLAALGEDGSAADRVSLTGDLGVCVSDADFVVEAAIEDLAFKQRLFAEIEACCGTDAILASNTSVIPITRIVEGLHHRQRALGTHWWNPPFLVPLVEVIGTTWTDEDVVARTMALHEAIGKTPVRVARDVPGFIGNRLQHALWREAISLVQNGICDAETVDTVVKASFGRRLAVLGPLENADLVGTDLTLAIHRTVLPAIDGTPVPSPYLETLVAEGRLGMKTNRGFRSWTPEQQDRLKQDLFEHLLTARGKHSAKPEP